VQMVKNQMISDADSFAAAIKESIAALKANPTGGDLPIDVKRDDGPSVRFAARVQGDQIRSAPPVQVERRGGRGSSSGSSRGGVNVWQNTGGGGRDNPNE
jgi:hypothetical protein